MSQLGRKLGAFLERYHLAATIGVVVLFLIALYVAFYAVRAVQAP